MNQRDKKYIQRRLKLLNETARELKKLFKVSKIPILEDLYLEIECYTQEIQGRLNIVERRRLWNKR